MKAQNIVARIALIGFLFSGLSQPAFAFENEPEGFRGIKWGTPISSNKSEMTLIERDAKLSVYLRKGDKLRIGEAKLTSLSYGYYKEHFFMAAMTTQGASNKTELLRAFKAQFGEGDRPNELLDKYVWAGATTSIIIECNPITDACQVWIASISIVKQMEADNEEAAKKSGKDF